MSQSLHNNHWWPWWALLSTVYTSCDLICMHIVNRDISHYFKFPAKSWLFSSSFDFEVFTLLLYVIIYNKVIVWSLGYPLHVYFLIINTLETIFSNSVIHISHFSIKHSKQLHQLIIGQWWHNMKDLLFMVHASVRLRKNKEQHNYDHNIMMMSITMITTYDQHWWIQVYRHFFVRYLTVYLCPMSW